MNPYLLDGKNKTLFSRGPRKTRCEGMRDFTVVGGRMFADALSIKNLGFSALSHCIAVIVLSVIKLMASAGDITIKFATLS